MEALVNVLEAIAADEVGTRAEIAMRWVEADGCGPRFEIMVTACKLNDCVGFGWIAESRNGQLMPPTGYTALVDENELFRMDLMDRHIFHGIATIEAPEGVEALSDITLPKGGGLGMFGNGSSRRIVVECGLSDDDYADFQEKILLCHLKYTYAEMKPVLDTFRRKAKAERATILMIAAETIDNAIDVVTDDLVEYTAVNNGQFVRRAGCVDISTATFIRGAPGKVLEVKPASRPEWFNSYPKKYHVNHPLELGKEWSHISWNENKYRVMDESLGRLAPFLT
jgi:hypothetical protein